MIFFIATEPTFEQMIWDYLRTTGAYWWVIVPGVLMPARDILNLFKRLGKTPRWLELAVIFVCLSIAQFLAYRNTVKNLYAVIEEKRQYSIQNNALTTELQQEKQRNVNIQSFNEPADSLRRRTEKAADELYEYLKKRAESQPSAASPNSNDPNPSEERKKKIQASQKYAQDTADYYLKHFKDRMVGILREYQAKGVPTRFLENDFKQRVPGMAYIGSDWEGSSLDELSQFRDLAYHVEARDNLITF